MASQEQIELSNYIKKVHTNLRNKSKEIGFETAWQEHCENNKVLEEYANIMKKLATEYWDRNAVKDIKVISRITWVYDYVNNYFFTELIRQRNRELEVLSSLNINNNILTMLSNSEQLNVLDVGSCYNPFKIYNNYNVLPIDIAPSNDDVYKCDFISVKIDEDNIIENKTVMCLRKKYFNVVIFSLLLEYIPSPEKRLQCCLNAYDLLDFEGILIIITPDSKHVGANVKYMKSWRYALSLIGFSRIKYEKLPYLHCMVFRKCVNIEFSKRWAKMNENNGYDNCIYIPQDDQEKDDDNE